MEPRWWEEDPWVPQAAWLGHCTDSQAQPRTWGITPTGQPLPGGVVCATGRGERREAGLTRKRGEIQDSGEGVVQEKPERKPRSRSLSPVVGGGEGMGSP